ncbi:histidine kinase [Novosphingobium sp. PhB165]|uniref:sensor histidine kinase n=1 Tax=Novosphingobium sp. PhB165 TaxID=2485105 RepID=UPI00104A0EB4|nr:histidine kinase [Novosphingobium sp. PhB165]TCM20865.1 histidine kinase [Novosphingobium sp. PhB165]
MAFSELSYLIERLAGDMSVDALAAETCTPEDVRVTLLRARDDERRRLARDLHDVLAQHLFILELELQSLHDGRAEYRERAHRSAKSTIDELQRQIRCFSYLLHPPELEVLGLADALDTLVSGMAARTGIDVEFDTYGYKPGACHETELSLFRVAQAALMNVFKHSGAGSAQVRLKSRRNWIVLTVRDYGPSDGHAAKPPVDPRDCGVGLNGMHARMAGLCGRFTVRSSQDGTVVTAIAPRRLGDDCAMDAALFEDRDAFPLRAQTVPRQADVLRVMKVLPAIAGSG